MADPKFKVGDRVGAFPGGVDNNFKHHWLDSTEYGVISSIDEGQTIGGERGYAYHIKFDKPRPSGYPYSEMELLSEDEAAARIEKYQQTIAAAKSQVLLATQQIQQAVQSIKDQQAVQSLKDRDLKVMRELLSPVFEITDQYGWENSSLQC